ncbi:hypothetical protein N665_0007s0006 [Sinapis alba]|nr:hypothetical protein N665_0007s0006 [Sinapis alba]
MSLARAINSSDQFESSSLSSLLTEPLSTTTILQTLCLITHPPNALCFFDYLSTVNFPHSPHTFFLMLHLLSRNLNAACNFLFSIEKRSNGFVKLHPLFFNTLITSYADAGLLRESLNLFHTMKKMSVSPSLITFNTLLSILLKRGKTGLALDLFREMKLTYGVTPDSYTFNILINGFCKNSMVSEAFRVFKDMDCVPDLVTYNTIIDGLCRVGTVKTAHNMLNGMVERDVVSYTTLVRGYCMKQEVDKALDVFNELVVTKGMKPNTVTFNTLIKGLSEAQKFDEIKQVLKLGDGITFAPDACTFNVLIKAHCNGGDVDTAVEVFREMSRPDSALYTVLIRAMCLRREFERAQRLFEELFEKEVLMLERDGSKPLAAAYNPMFEYLCANGKMRRSERLVKRGFANECFELIRVMLEKWTRLKIDLSTDVVRLMFNSGQKNKAFMIVRLVYENGYLVKMEELIDFLCEKRKLVDSDHRLALFCLENNQMVDINRWNRVIEKLYKHKRHSEAIGLYNELVEIGKNHQELSCIVVLRNAFES